MGAAVETKDVTRAREEVDIFCQPGVGQEIFLIPKTSTPGWLHLSKWKAKTEIGSHTGRESRSSQGTWN